MASMDWIGKPYKTKKTYKYYKSILIDGEIYSVNDIVCLLNEDDPRNPFLAKIVELFSNSNDKSGEFFMKNKWFFRHSDVANPKHVLPKKRNMLNMNAGTIKKYEIFESCRYKNMKDLDVNDCESIDGKCQVMTMENFANFAISAKVPHTPEVGIDDTNAYVSKEKEEVNFIIPQDTYFCNYLYNPATGVFRPKNLTKKKLRRQNNSSTCKATEGRPESPWDRPDVRVGVEYQIDPAQIPKTMLTGDNEWLKNYETDNKRLQYDNKYSQIFDAGKAKLKNVNTKLFLERAKALSCITFDEALFLQILHQCDYDESETLKKIQHYKETGSKRRRYMSNYDTRSEDVNENCKSKRKKGIPKNFMSSNWAYNVIEQFNARLVPYSRQCKPPKNKGANPTTLCSPTTLKSNSDLESYNSNNEDENSDICVICKSSGMLLCCDGEGCGSSFHLKCLGLKNPPTIDKWLCLPCRQNEKYKLASVTRINTNVTPSSKTNVLNIQTSPTMEKFNPIYKPQLLERGQNNPSPVSLMLPRNTDDMSLSPKSAMVIKSDLAMKLKKRILL